MGASLYTLFFRYRKIDVEFSSLTDLAVDRNDAGVVFDYPICRSQPQPCPTVLILGREKRIENLLADGLIHADARYP